MEIGNSSETLPDCYATYFYTVRLEYRPITDKTSVYRDNTNIKKGLVVALKMKLRLRLINLKCKKNQKVINFAKFKWQAFATVFLIFEISLIL